MNERERRKYEMLVELSRRFESNSAAMKKIADRIQSAANQSRQLQQNLQSLDQNLQQSISDRPGNFSYLEYLEFSAAEFKKFRTLPPVNAEEIAAVDFDRLIADLQKE